MSKKSGGCKNPVQNSTIKAKKDVVLNELGTRHVFWTLWVSHANQILRTKMNQSVLQAFKITFDDRQCSTMFLDASSYANRSLEGTEKVNILYI